jgi:hypothetical protein
VLHRASKLVPSVDSWSHAQPNQPHLPENQSLFAVVSPPVARSSWRRRDVLRSQVAFLNATLELGADCRSSRSRLEFLTEWLQRICVNNGIAVIGVPAHLRE